MTDPTDPIIFTISDQTQKVKFTYTNWKGETRQRQASLWNIFFGSNDWHKEPQWLTRGWDLEKNAERTFSLKDITNIERINYKREKNDF